MIRRAIHAVRARRLRGEDGLSLIFALGVISFLGVFVATALTLTYTSFKTTQVVRAADHKLYGADGGADIGIQMLRNSSSYCSNVSSTPESLPDQTINGKTVRITCQTLSGTTGGTGGGAAGDYSLVVTGYDKPGGGAPDFTKLFELDGKDKLGTDSLTITGKVFNAGSFRFKSDAPVLIMQSDLDQHNPYCTTDKATSGSSGQPTVQGAWTCRTASSFPVPDPAPTLKVPTAAAPAKVDIGSCTIFYPGRYTSEPKFDKDRQYYLASGVYYFDNIGSIDFKGQIFGGQPGPNESQKFTTISPCANDATANSHRPGSATGYGVELVLGGSSQLTIEDEKKSKVELFSRVPAVPANEGTPGVSVYAPRTAGTGYSAWDSGKAFDIKGKDPQIVVHGLVYIPTSRFDEQFVVANTEAGNATIFGGGLVVQFLKLKFKSDAAHLKFVGVPTIPATTRTVVVTATADGAPGEAPTVVKAVLELGTGTGTPATVLSWRKV